MEGLQFKSIIQCKPFRFLVGVKKYEFFVHPTLISHHSRPLSVLMNGSMQEAINGYASIDDVDGDTFARFVEYLYTGEYPAAEPLLLLDDGAIAQQHADQVRDSALPPELQEQPVHAEQSTTMKDALPAHEHDPWTAFSTTTTKTRKKPMTSQQRAWREFQSISFEVCAARPDSAPRANQEAYEGYTDVFLSHAKIYVFADRYDINNLRSLSLQKLHNTLVQFTLFEQRVSDIASLLQYCYEHTAEREGSTDDLRSLITRYVCCNLESMMKDETFRRTMKGDHVSSWDILNQVLHRLN
ncbi:uncharacterized protein RCC_09854 [Ramularia collo-cygni]|uniref:BTB domain-containing protein n=1 Tax=Ramularia collo-cygni TaxID=112498 RepID=A0A2D3V1D6_9PEZI|nr:uncharacterized protein RCC_09854 [Ramularia collo-cygni]CZT24137.1 uncharacterized protein RCC_09854 [Ramularia collo-cygni]